MQEQLGRCKWDYGCSGILNSPEGCSEFNETGSK